MSYLIEFRGLFCLDFTVLFACFPFIAGSLLALPPSLPPLPLRAHHSAEEHASLLSSTKCLLFAIHSQDNPHTTDDPDWHCSARQTGTKVLDKAVKA
jgi:hypothetical protein